MPDRVSLPRAPQPTRILFDPFNSSATGHQRAENRLSGSTSWRDSRSHKLSHQFRDSTGGGGASHRSDLVGAGRENFGQDGRKENGDWEVGAPGLRESGWQDIRNLLSPKPKDPHQETSEKLSSIDKDEPSASAPEVSQANQGVPKRRIFSGLTIYLNGSTAPLVGDHKLKHLLVQHGANISITLGRRTVTHVILGETKDVSGGAKGLAAGKIQKEMTRVGGKGVKYVNVHWVLESIKTGRRLPEAQFSALNLNPRGSRGVYGMFQTAQSEQSSPSLATHKPSSQGAG